MLLAMKTQCPETSLCPQDALKTLNLTTGPTLSTFT